MKERQLRVKEKELGIELKKRVDEDRRSTAYNEGGDLFSLPPPEN